jgi:hypothetical protein
MDLRDTDTIIYTPPSHHSWTSERELGTLTLTKRKALISPGRLVWWPRVFQSTRPHVSSSPCTPHEMM